MKKQHVRWMGLIVAYVTTSVSLVGCMNFLREGPGSSHLANTPVPVSKTVPHVGTPSAPSASATLEPTIEGNWQCADSQCDSDTLKTISSKQDTVETTSTIRDVKSMSMCRVHEVSQLRVVDDHGDDNLEAEITPVSIQVVDSDENTKNCADLYKQPLDEKTSVKILQTVDQGIQEIEVAGVKYRRILDVDVKRVVAAHSKSKALNLNLPVSSWACVDAGLEQNEITISLISGDLTIISDFVQTFDSNQNCLVEEKMKVSRIEPGPQGNPNKITVYMVPQQIVPVEPGSCEAQVDQYNEKPLSTNAIPHVLTFDGTGKFTLQGKHYMRQVNSIR